MSYLSKLRWSIGFYYPVAILSSYILIIIELLLRHYLVRQGYIISTKPWITFIIVGIFFFIMGIIQWFKYRLWINPVLGAMIGVICFNAARILGERSLVNLSTYLILLIILILFIILNWRTFYNQERFERNSRRLFRLAAELINDTGNGFTERPFTAGKIDLSKEELEGFARFLNGKFIAKPFYHDKRTTFTISMNKSLLVINSPHEVSYVDFDQSGNITVVISKNDYGEYTKRFSFDRLCNSMAMVFTRFLAYYKQGMENRIITELKSAR